MYNLDKRKILIIKHLINHKQYISSDVLASAIGSNSRTVRDDIKVVDAFLQNFGAGIEARAGLGYAIRFDDFNEYQTFLQVFREKYNDDSMIPSYSRERVSAILRILLMRDCVKTQELMDILYISKTTFNMDIKAVRILLGQYHLELIHRPGYGFELRGKERHIRVLLSDYLYGDEEDGTESAGTLRYILDNKQIQEQLIAGFCKHHIHVGANRFYEIVNYILASAARYEAGHEAELIRGQEERVQAMTDYAALHSIVSRIWPQAPEHELGGLILYIQSRRVYGYEDAFGRKANETLYSLFYEIKNYVALCTNSHIIMGQRLEELVPRVLKGLLLRVSLGYESRGMQIINARQKNEAYDLAALICYYIGEKCRLSIPESEIVCLANELQEPFGEVIREATVVKQDICIVSAWGKNGGLVYRKSLLAGNRTYIRKIEQREFYEIKEGENDFDILVTDIPKVKFNIDGPVFQIKHGLNEREGKHFSALISLKQERGRRFCSYFNSRLFFPDQAFDSREAVLRHLAREMEAECGLEGLWEKFAFQDTFSSAERGNNAAVCHSFWAKTEDTHIGVTILRRPVQWNHELVSIVFAVALGSRDKALYGSVANLSALITDIELVHGLLHVRDYAELMEQIEAAFERNELI